MNWFDFQTWKQCFISTLICLFGCSIGNMGLAYYLTSYHWVFILLVSLVAGFITSMVFMIVRDIVFRKINFKDSLKSSYKMSIVSMLIMMLAENIIILYIAPQFLPLQMNMAGMHQIQTHTTHTFNIMAIAMTSGFLLSLPYNYYQLQKTGKICH